MIEIRIIRVKKVLVVESGHLKKYLIREKLKTPEQIVVFL